MDAERETVTTIDKEVRWNVIDTVTMIDKEVRWNVIDTVTTIDEEVRWSAIDAAGPTIEMIDEEDRWSVIVMTTGDENRSSGIDLNDGRSRGSRMLHAVGKGEAKGTL